MYHFYCILITTLIFVHVLYNIYGIELPLTISV